MRTALLTLLTIVLVNPSIAASTRIFISGHSLTDQPLPDQLAEIARSLQQPIDWNRQYMVGSSIKHRTRGRDAETGWAGYSQGDNRVGRGLDVITDLRQRPYDVLMLTEQHGLLDSLVWHDTVRHLRHYHERLIEGNPRGRTYFFEPWLGIPGKTEVRRWIDYERRAAPRWHCVATRINTALASEGRSDRIATLPVSLALADLVERATTGTGVEGVTAATVGETLDRVFQDNVHLKPLGSYFAALVVFGGIFERPTQGAWAPPGVSPTQAASLQRVADEAAATHRARSAPDPATCRSLLDREFVDLYLDHMRDDYWAKQDGSRVRMAWRRIKHNLKTRWQLWRSDPMGWDSTSGYWFAKP